jgi:putative transposase
MQHGFLYLTAVMDIFSRNVLSWRLSNTLTGDFCVEALDAALSKATPEIFNTDQGAQFTANAFTSRLIESGVACPWMDVAERSTTSSSSGCGGR